MNTLSNWLCVVFAEILTAQCRRSQSRAAGDAPGRALLLVAAVNQQTTNSPFPSNSGGLSLRGQIVAADHLAWSSMDRRHCLLLALSSSLVCPRAGKLQKSVFRFFSFYGFFKKILMYKDRTQNSDPEINEEYLIHDIRTISLLHHQPCVDYSVAINTTNQTGRPQFSAVTVSLKSGLLKVFLKKNKTQKIWTFQVFSFFSKINPKTQFF